MCTQWLERLLCALALRPLNYSVCVSRLIIKQCTENCSGRQAEEVDPEGMVKLNLLLRNCDDGLTPSGTEPAEAGQKEIFSSWALFILIVLLITALFTSYILQQKKIQAVHETVISIFAGTITWPSKDSDMLMNIGMVVGLIIRVTPGRSIQDNVSFDYQ